MSLLTPITDALVTVITGSVLPAVLTVMGAMLALSISVYGLIKLYDLFLADGNGSTFRRVGRSVGSEVQEARYRSYKRGADQRAQTQQFAVRYNRERSSRGRGF